MSCIQTPRRVIPLLAALGLCLSLFPPPAVPSVRSAAAVQDGGGVGAASTASRVASLLELAIEEYGAAIRDGEVVNQMEYEEAAAFTRQAGERYRDLLEGTPEGEVPDGADALLPVFDDLLPIIEEKGEVSRFRDRVDELVRRLGRVWGAASLQMPERQPSAARGAAIYRQACAACHGPAGRGDGWAAEGMRPPPTDLAAAHRYTEATPARDYQVVTYGVPRTAMPESGDWLDVEGRWDVVAYLQTLRYTAAEAAEGNGLAAGTPEVAGVTGEGAPLAGWIRSWGSVEEAARWTDEEIGRQVRTAWRRAAPGSDSLSAGQVRSVVAYARTLLGTSHDGAPEADRSVQVARRIEEIDSLLAGAVAASREGQVEVARGRAIESYMTFEALEPELRARAPGLTTATEATFGDFRNALGTGRLDAVRDTLAHRLEEVEATLTSVSSGFALAGQSFFIILREGFEAILLIGAIIAFLMKTGNEEKRRTVYGGVWAAVGASVLTAVAIEMLLSVTPAEQELLEGITMLLATAVLFSVSYWLLSKLEHEKWETYLRNRLSTAVGKGGGLALASVAFLAVYREGFETVLFYKALVISGGGRWLPLVGGFLVGCVALAVIYVLFTRYGVKIPMRPFFAITSGVLYYMAVVFLGQGIYELQQAGVVGMTPVAGVPRMPLLGLYPTVQTLAGQGVMLLLLAGAVAYTFRPGRGTLEPAGG